MELFRQSINGNASYNFKVTTYIAICDVEFVDGAPAPAILDQFIRIVEDIVMAIEAESDRLGIG
jgi:hypothetical protein